MSNKFLGASGSAVSISNGTLDIFAASLSAVDLDPSKAVKTNSVRQLVSSNLDISDVNDLQNQLNNTLQNPFPGTLQVGDLETELTFSLNDDVVQPVLNFEASTDTVDGKTTGVDGLFYASTLKADSLADETGVNKIDMNEDGIALTALSLTIGEFNILNDSGIGTLGDSFTTEQTTFTDQQLVTKKYVDDVTNPLEEKTVDISKVGTATIIADDLTVNGHLITNGIVSHNGCIFIQNRSIPDQLLTVVNVREYTTPLENGEDLIVTNTVVSDGTTTAACAEQHVTASEDFSTNGNGIDYTIKTTKNGSTTSTERIQIKGNDTTILTCQSLIATGTLTLGTGALNGNTLYEAHTADYSVLSSAMMGQTGFSFDVTEPIEITTVQIHTQHWDGGADSRDVTLWSGIDGVLSSNVFTVPNTSPIIDGYYTYELPVAYPLDVDTAYTFTIRQSADDNTSDILLTPETLNPIIQNVIGRYSGVDPDDGTNPFGLATYPVLTEDRGGANKLFVGNFKFNATGYQNLTCGTITSTTTSNLEAKTTDITYDDETNVTSVTSLHVGGSEVLTVAGGKNLDSTLSTSQNVFTGDQELITKKYVDDFLVLYQ